MVSVGPRQELLQRLPDHRGQRPRDRRLGQRRLGAQVRGVAAARRSVVGPLLKDPVPVRSAPSAQDEALPAYREPTCATKTGGTGVFSESVEIRKPQRPSINWCDTQRVSTIGESSCARARSATRSYCVTGSAP